MIKRISLTTRGFLLLVVLVASFIAALVSGPQQELIWRAAALLVCLLFVAEWLVHQKIQIIANLTSEPEVQLSEPSQISIAVDVNASVRYTSYLSGNAAFQVYAQTQLPDGLNALVLPLKLSTEPPGNLHIRTEGILGLTAWDSDVEIEGKVSVIPARSFQSTALNGEKMKQRHVDKIAGQGFELDRLRDYQIGDSVRFIDWKATAKRRKKTVRLFTDDNQQDVCILLDASHYGRVEVDGISRFSHMLNTAARLSNLALASGDQVSFCAYGSATKALVPPGGSHLQHQKIVRSLSHLELDDGPANHLMGYMSASRHLLRRSLLVFVTHMDHAALTDHLSQTIALASHKHLVITVSILDDDLPTLIAAKPRHWQDPFHALAATQVHSATDSLIGKLRKQGAQVIHARHSQIDEELVTTYRRLRERRMVS